MNEPTLAQILEAYRVTELQPAQGHFLSWDENTNRECGCPAEALRRSMSKPLSYPYGHPAINPDIWTYTVTLGLSHSFTTGLIMGWDHPENYAEQYYVYVQQEDFDAGWTLAQQAAKVLL